MSKSNGFLKLLIVDDLKTMREDFVSVCRQFAPHARIDEAQDVMSAMQYLQKEIPAYDAVFTDINMPHINGLKLITLAREMPLYKKVPIIVISVLSSKQEVEAAIRIGANGYLIRPLKPADFEVVFLTYLEPIQATKTDTDSDSETDAMLKSLRNILK